MFESKSRFNVKLLNSKLDGSSFPNFIFNLDFEVKVKVKVKVKVPTSRGGLVIYLGAC